MKQKILVCWALATLLAISGSTQEAVGIFDGSTNIGDAAVEGIITYNEDDNLYSIDAAGTGVDDFQDSVFFIYQELSGNFSIECLPFPLAEGEGGLMIRESLEPGSPFAALMREMDGDVNPYFRTLPNQAMSSDGEFSADSLLDGTVRLERMGNSIHFYTLDADGAWDLEQTEILDLPDTLYVGLALASGNNDTTTFYDFEFVSVEEYPFSVNRDFGTDAPAPGEQLNVTLTANAADVVNATVTEIIPQGSVIADLTTDTGEIVETENGEIEWALPDFSGEATLTYTIDVPDRNIAIWRGAFTDGETVRDGDDLREGWIGGDLLVAESLEMQPRDTLSVHPEVPRFVEAEWGHLTGETQTYGLHLFPQSDSGLLVHAVESSSSNILDSILEFNLNVQEAGTYYFFAQTRNEDNQSDSFFGGFDTVDTSDASAFAMGSDKELNRRWWQTFEEGGRFWNRTDEKRGFDLSAGEHTFLISPRESNGNIDWFVITSDPTINIDQFTPREQFFTISRDMPSTGSELPDSLSVTLDLGVVQDSNLDLRVEEQIPEGWSASDISASAGETEMVDNTLVWTLTGVNNDAELTYTATPGADSTFGVFAGTAQDMNSGVSKLISGDSIVPEQVPFQLQTEPIDVPADEITFIQAEAPHEVSGDFIVEGDVSLISKLYAMPTSSGRSGGAMEDQELTFNLNVLQDDTYYIFANTRSESNSTDSFYIGFDAEFPGMSDGSENDQYGYAVAGEGEFVRAWQYLFEEGERFWATTDEPRPHELTAGSHTLNWHSREPEAKVDWIAITTDPTLDLDAILEPGQEPDTQVEDFMLY